jgi:transcription elongation factor Elf1
MNQQFLNQSTHCPNCGRCFCGVAKTQTSDGKTMCVNCKPVHEANLNALRNQVKQ